MAFEKTELTAPDGGQIVKVQFDDGSVRVFAPEVYAELEPQGEAALKAHDQAENAEPRSEGLDPKGAETGEDA